MAYFKIVSDITKMGAGKVKMNVEFYDDSSVKIGDTEMSFEVDADTDEGIAKVLSQAAKDRASIAAAILPEITISKNKLIEAN